MNCKNLIHPFQNDQGVSQHQRIIDDLLAGSAKIDGRNMADMLDYFVQISHHINFQDTDGSMKDWQPFFAKSLPFIIANISKFNSKAVNDKMAAYNLLFDKKPTKAGLYLVTSYFFKNIILPLNTWQKQLHNSDLQVELRLNKLINDKLKSAIQTFIIYSNASVRYFNTKTIDFSDLAQNDIWGLDTIDLYLNLTEAEYIALGTTKRKKRIALRDKIVGLVANFLEVIKRVADFLQVSNDLETSLFPLKEELREKHAPHLAILFSFIKLFAHLQDDLNGFSKKHLDFFYKKVLKLKAHEATPDKAHIVFDIQNQLEKYLLKKGLLLKDGKDANKAEIIFATDDEIVVNKAQVADKRTLFLNNQTISKTIYVEGVYMAPNAGMADGIDKEFKDDEPASWETLGAKYSKYIDPENKFTKPYPNARLGFILASPVLLLNEGKRTVTITLDCELRNNCEVSKDDSQQTEDCCGNAINTSNPKDELTSFYEAANLYNEVSTILGQTFYYINRELIAVAVKKGISKDLVDKLNEQLIVKQTLCDCTTEVKLYEKTLTESEFLAITTSTIEQNILKDIFKPRKALNVLFSGEKEWINPNATPTFTLSALAGNTFELKIEATLLPDQKAVTFYNAEALKEDFDSTLPVVKIELDDKIKLFNTIFVKNNTQCCERDFDKKQPISLYHFFRNVVLKKPTIEVQVCGLKNFIVQNDESLQDVNAPIYPFGTRPKVDANFYIGSREVFCKKWVNVRLNINWKDKPLDFGKHYEGYEKDGLGYFGLHKENFSIKIAALENGIWNKHGKLDGLGVWAEDDETIQIPIAPLKIGFPDKLPKLFDNLLPSVVVPPLITCETFEQNMLFTSTDFHFANQKYCIEDIDFKNFNVNNREGFLKITLKGQDFRHDKYSYVLARQMMALGKLPKDHIEDAVYYDKDHPNKLFVFSTDDIKTELINVGNIINQVNGVINQVTGDKDNVKVDKDKLVDDITNLTNDKGNLMIDATTLRGDINSLKDNDINITLKDNVDNLRADADLVTGNVINLSNHLDNLDGDVTNLVGMSDNLLTDVDNLDTKLTTLETHITTDLIALESNLASHVTNLGTHVSDLGTHVSDLGTKITGINQIINDNSNFQAVIPNEPWTPIIKEMSLDYTATATATDIDLIHLYPYHNTYKNEAIELHPTLFPTFCEEGNLFIGLKNFVPGSNLNMLFQVAEATADSEAERQDLKWAYLENNTWKTLRKDFEVLGDATDGLTTSGIVKFALPANMTNQNSILPKDLHWIKASISESSTSVSEVFAIHTQAIRATFVQNAENDLLRLDKPLPANAISKLVEADASVKKVMQPFEAFGGMIPEDQGQFYVRVSELLRHKGRAIQKFDYERLVLDAFPQIFKAKCINHSFGLDAHRYANDYPMAPGYVILAAIPDLNKLKAAQQFEPKVPISLLEKIENYIKQRTSPFVRLKVANPRYEKVNFCLKVKLYLGKDENFYKEKLKQDLREFMAPWAIGEYSKLTFGQCISRSDIIRHLESREYIDNLLDLEMVHEDNGTKPIEVPEVCPITPRSILIAGDIDVCIVTSDCEHWDYENVCQNKAETFDRICK